MLSSQMQALLREALAAQAKGRSVEAARLFAKLRVAAPNDVAGWYHGGILALRAGETRQAVELLSRAVAIDPRSLPAGLALGVAHLANGDAPAAESLFRQLVERFPKSAEAWRYLGLVYETQGRTADACEARARDVALAPKQPEGWVAYGSILSTAGRAAEALTCFDRALKLDRANPRARVGRAKVLLRCHRTSEAVEELKAALATEARDWLAWSSYLMALNNRPEISREQLAAEHRKFGALIGGPADRRWPNAPEPERRLRVGFLSRDLCEHSVGFFLEPLVRNLDPRQFELLFYHDQGRADAVTERLRARASRWRSIAGQPDPTVEALVLGDAPDVLVDLAGHTAGNRLPLLARRLAPVQITYLGYPNTTGVPAMDYRFVDALTDPEPEGDGFASEKLVRFAPCAWSYLPPADAPPVAPLPCLGGQPVTFGSFNNLAKVSDEVLGVWARILEAVPGARLLIKASGIEDPLTSEPLRERLRRAGIGDSQVELHGHTADVRSHLALYSRVDVALDPFPYNGTTTTCEALWMGVPVVTLAGDRHAGRVGLSLLTAVGYPEWVVATPEAYIVRACELVGDPARLERIRSALRSELNASVVLDHAAQSARFGAALLSCWRTWCRSRDPQAVGDEPQGSLT